MRSGLPSEPEPPATVKPTEAEIDAAVERLRRWAGTIVRIAASDDREQEA